MSTLQLEAPVIVRARPARRSLRSVFLWTNCLALLAVAVLLRCWHLGNLPGLNGDEAWYGVQAQMLVSGQDLAWETPTGNPLNPLLIMPLFALHYFFEPSIILLRLPALVSGLAALVVNYVLCGRAFDRRTAVVSTLLLAVLPINIAYSRFAWDASQTLLVTLLVMYLPLVRLNDTNGRVSITPWTIIACVAAVFVHPTNVFAFAFPLVTMLYVRRERIAQLARNASMPNRPWAFALVVLVLATLAALLLYSLPAIAARVHGPRDLGPFLAAYLRLFSGTTIYQFVSGAGLHVPGAGWFRYTTIAGSIGCGLLAVWALCGLWRRIQHSPSAVDACLVSGWLVMLLGFFILAGPEALQPHFERYGICLIGPGVLVLSRGLTVWLEQPGPCARRLEVMLALAVWLWPASFYVNYTSCIEQRGGLSHNAFRTGEVEPKLAAIDYVLTHRRPDRPIALVCHEWWTYWPVRYLTFREPETRVLTWDEWQATVRDPQPDAAETWFIEFSGSTGEFDALRATRTAGMTRRWHTLLDYGGRPVVSVITRAENFSQNH